MGRFGETGFLSMSFCEEAWECIAPIRAAIYAHPFLHGLADGSLPRPLFQHYIVQDSHYLADYARVLALVSARAPDAAARLEFSDGAKVAVQVEAALHQNFFAQYGVSQSTPPSPTCIGYSSYLIKLASTRSYEEAIAALLPCFWIYWDVGQTMFAQSPDDNPYADWVSTYADPAFGAATARVKVIVDAAATPAARPAMLNAFETSARYEWMFWNAAWLNEGWPI
jgi:thiaminase (transcriptional activator TenA)